MPARARQPPIDSEPKPRSPSATVEQIEDRGDRPERPETSIRADDRRLDRLIPRAEPEADARIEGGPRDADPRIGGDQAALRLGDVGTALKKFGGQGRRQVRQRKASLRGIDGENRGALANQRRDPVLDPRALRP